MLSTVGLYLNIFNADASSLQYSFEWFKRILIRFVFETKGKQLSKHKVGELHSMQELIEDIAAQNSNNKHICFQEKFSNQSIS